MKKIALIYTSVSLTDDFSTGKSHEEVMPPLWALALATYLRAALPSVKLDIIDEQLLGREGLRKKLALARYDLAGFSPVAHTYKRVLDCARQVKKNGAMVVMGGHYAPTLAKEILANRGPGSPDHCVDAIVRYDGENALYELARGTSFKNIKNLVYPGPGGKIIENLVEILDMARLPPVDYTLVKLADYFRRQLPPAHSCLTLPFAAQRGCRLAQGAGRCAFCSIQSSGGVRALPPEAAALQISFLARKFGVGYVYESSDDFVSDPDWLKQYASAAGLERPVLHVHASASLLNPGNISLLKAVNAQFVNMGIESMSAAVLRALGKGSTVAGNRRAILRLMEAGLTPNVNLILGLSGETRETLSETFSELKKLKLPAGACRRISLPTLAVFPGTGVWRRLLAKEPKYHGQDMLNYEESFRDWLKHFCGVSEADVMSAKVAIEDFFVARRKLLERSGQG